MDKIKYYRSTLKSIINFKKPICINSIKFKLYRKGFNKTEIIECINILEKDSMFKNVKCVKLFGLSSNTLKKLPIDVLVNSAYKELYYKNTYKKIYGNDVMDVLESYNIPRDILNKCHEFINSNDIYSLDSYVLNDIARNKIFKKIKSIFIKEGL